MMKIGPLALRLSLFVAAVTLCCASNSVTYTPTILVSMDGMGWQFPGGQVANTPNLDFVAKTGIQAKYMETVTPTKTWPNHQTYLTGLYPESHGMVTNKFWDPIFKEKFIFEYDCSNYDPKFWTMSEPLWLTMQKKGIDTAVYFWPGFSSYDIKPTYYEKPICKVNCSDIKDLPASRKPIRKEFPPYDHCCPNYTIPFQTRADSIVSWLSSEKPPRFVAWYVDQPDWVGHSDGSKSQKFKEKVEAVDRDAVGYLINKLKAVNLLEKVNLIFVADHSFVDVNASRVLFLDDYVDLSSSIVMETGPFVHIWPNEGRFEDVYNNLTKLTANLPLGKLYKKDETPETWHYKHNRRIPPIYLDVGYGWLVHTKRTNLSDDWVYGAHGYPSGKSMGSVFYARGPSFKKGYKIDGGIRSLDIYPMLCEILGIEPLPHNGSLDNMKMMMIRMAGVQPTPKAAGNTVALFDVIMFCALILNILSTLI